MSITTYIKTICTYIYILITWKMLPVWKQYVSVNTRKIVTNVSDCNFSEYTSSDSCKDWVGRNLQWSANCLDRKWISMTGLRCGPVLYWFVSFCKWIYTLICVMHVRNLLSMSAVNVFRTSCNNGGYWIYFCWKKR